MKNSGINGAVKWFGKGRVLLAINNRRMYADTFWFSLFHEIKHILQQKVSLTFISGDYSLMDIKLEKEADEFASDYLLPKKDYKHFVEGVISEKSIRSFAEEISIHPGIIVGRLQHDKLIPQNRFNQLKERYIID